MKNSLIFTKTCIVISLFLMLNIFAGSIDQLKGATEGSYVTVTLRTGAVKNLERASFEIKWIFPVTILEDETCVEKTFNKEDIKDIFPISKAWNPCEKEEDWLFEVDFWDNDYTQGFVMPKCKLKEDAEIKIKDKETPGTFIKGIDPATGKEESIEYKDIRKISFVKTNR